MTHKPLRLHSKIPDDLKGILDYLAEVGSGLASKFARGFRAALVELRKHPGRGSIKMLKIGAPETRSWSVEGFRNYLILYRIWPNAIRVLAVSHGSRDLDELLKDRA